VSAKRVEDAHLVIVDLSGEERNRRLVRWMATMALRRLAARRKPNTKVSLLAFAPFGDASTIEAPDEVERVSAASLIGPRDWDQLNEWAFETSNEIVTGSGRHLFPEIGGVNLGDLNLLDVQGYLRDYGMLLAAVRVFGEKVTVRRCTVVSGHPEIGAAIAREAKRFAQKVRNWHPPSIVHGVASLVGKMVNRESSRPLPDPPSNVERPRVLLVSASIPMRMMFEAIESNLHAVGVGPVLRLDYAPAASGNAPTGATVVARSAPSPAACPPPALRVIRDHRRVTQQAFRSGGGPGASTALRDVIARVPIERFVLGLTSRRYPDQLAYVADIDQVLTQLRPRVVVVSNDRYWLGQAIVRVAQRHGIPTLAVQDGIEGAHPGWFWASADVIAASGAIYPEYLTAHGVSPSRIHVVGQPRYDSFVRAVQSGDPEQQKRDARTRLGLDPDTFCVLFAAQPNQAPAYATQVVSSLVAVPGVQVVVRPHPSSDPRPYERLVTDFANPRVTLQQSPDTFVVLTACDVVVLQHSTVALEAAILDRLVVTANFSGVPDVVPFVDLGVATPARTPRELTETVARLAGLTATEHATIHANARRALERLIGPQDGQAGLRTATLIADIIAGSPTRTEPLAERPASPRSA
jgi:hypothetical protein